MEFLLTKVTESLSEVIKKVTEKMSCSSNSQIIFVSNGKVGVTPFHWASVLHSLEYAVS